MYMFVLQEQTNFYGAELKFLAAGKQLLVHNSLLQLCPFVDDGVLNVGARLAFGEHLPCDFAQRKHSFGAINASGA